MIGKFKTPEALWQSYQQLERAFTQKCQQIKRMEEQQMKVYEVKVDWATGEGYDCTTEIYADAEKARKAYNFEIMQAMQDYDVFDEETGELTENGWILDMSVNFWELWEDGYYTSNHCLITLTEKEVK
jgi:hypothetical protein